MIRTRFAPSPTGLMHIGSVRTALYAYLTARGNQGEFYLRIEDTDRNRFIEGSVEDIINNLKWLGLDFDKEPIYQSTRKEIYKKYADGLIEKGLAYKKDEAVWFKIPKEGKTSFTDLIGNRKIEFQNDSQKDFVILKSDGYPTYHLAHVVDDHLMEINPVIRGEEWLSSTPKHILLFEAFGWPIPQYAHLPLILGPDRSKLSKRHGAKPVSEFRKEGFLPDAILNYMALLGWTPSSNKELLEVKEMAEEFDLKDAHVAPAVFDITKLEWMNGVYIRQKSLENLAQIIKDYLLKYKNINIKKENTEAFLKIVSLAKDRINTLDGFYDLANHFFTEPDLKSKDETERKIVNDLIEKLENVQDWTKDNIFQTLKEMMEKHKIRMPVFYTIITGLGRGLPLPESMEILGKEKVLKRLNNLK